MALRIGGGLEGATSVSPNAQPGRLCHDPGMRLFPFVVGCFAAFTPEALAVTREQALATAASCAEHRWTPKRGNVLHGPDAAGIVVRTPDRSTGNPDLWQSGKPYAGVPYKWGGFDTIASFERGVRAGKAAGDLYNAEKRRKGGAAVSAAAVGLDCSGFISRCWGLSEKQSTRSIPALCQRLGSHTELRPGDVLNQPGGHVVLFVRWAGRTHTRFLCYEAEPFSRVRLSERHAVEMIAAGYSPLRYRQMRE
jgi:hypothetical protein